MRARVVQARAHQEKRFGDGRLNAQMGRKELETWAWPDAQTGDWLHQAGTKMGLSARSYDRILRVARTIADLAQEERIQLCHVQEAVQYRNIERNSDFGA